MSRIQRNHEPEHCRNPIFHPSKVKPKFTFLEVNFKSYITTKIRAKNQLISSGLQFSTPYKKSKLSFSDSGTSIFRFHEFSRINYPSASEPEQQILPQFVNFTKIIEFVT